MIDEEIKLKKYEEKETTRKRMRASIDMDNYEYYPAKKHQDYYDDSIQQKVAIYVRVSTEDIKQTTSFELQKKYYEDYVKKHSNWTLINIYADEGISGTSRTHRDGFNQMIQDCKNGLIDIIITKSVSRFARNVMVCIGVVRELAELKNPVGVFFESECIFSLNEDSQMALSFLATMAEEESHTRSRSMETSLRMRLDNGIPLTPKLFGYTHNDKKELIINNDEAPTVKLIFYLYLYGLSLTQINEILNKTNIKTYYGYDNWNIGTINSILKNERHCGDVLTRKTFTIDFREHKKAKNRGERAQSRYFNHHEPIISRDDFIAVQHMLDNAKYSRNGHSYLPTLKVITRGLLEGFTIVNSKYSFFNENQYLDACKQYACCEKEPSLYTSNQYELVKNNLFNLSTNSLICFEKNQMGINEALINEIIPANYFELLVNPIKKKLAIRTCFNDNKSKFDCSIINKTRKLRLNFSIKAVYETLYRLFSWDINCSYKIKGSVFEENGIKVITFNADDAEQYITLEDEEIAKETMPIVKSGTKIKSLKIEEIQKFGPIIDLKTLQQKQNKTNFLFLNEHGVEANVTKQLETTSKEEIEKYIKEQLPREIDLESYGIYR